MASGILGVAAPLAVTQTTVYTAPGGSTSTVSVNMCNNGVATILVRLATSATGTPAADKSEYLEYDVPILPNGVLERTGIVMAPTQNIVAYTDIATLSVVVQGYEE